jgi:hypothetical protein
MARPMKKLLQDFPAGVLFSASSCPGIPLSRSYQPFGRLTGELHHPLKFFITLRNLCQVFLVFIKVCKGGSKKDNLNPHGAPIFDPSGKPTFYILYP